MSRILYAWEIGTGYGHVASFLPVALELRKRGHEVLLALRDVSNADAVLDGHDFPVFQAPVWLHPVSGLRGPPVSYAEILFRFGYLSVPGLTGLVRTWRRLFDSLKVDMVVADHSPTALLAARGTPVRRVAFGNGFPSPPRVRPLPNMRAWWDVPHAQLVESERRVLEVVNRALAQLGGTPLEALHDLFAVDENFLCTFAELDHYQAREGAQYWGPVISMDEGEEPQWPAARGKRRIFVYLRPHRNSESVLKTLNTIDCEALVVAPGLSPKALQRLQTDTIRLSTRPVKISQVTRQCDLCVCNAGHGTTAAMLLAGVPLLLLPIHLEHYLTAFHVTAYGAALLVDPDKPEPDYARLFEELLGNPLFALRAKKFAESHATFDPAAQVGAIAQRVETLLEREHPGYSAGA